MRYNELREKMHGEILTLKRCKMNMILFENPPTVYFERIEDYEEKSTPWRRVPPTYKGSSTKSGRNKKQIRRDRKRNKKR